MDEVDDDTRFLLLAASAAEKGTWPVTGGLVEQARTAVDAIQMVWSDRVRMARKHG